MAVIIGSALADFLSGDPIGVAEADLIFGNDGSDVISGLRSDDSLFGGNGNDVVNGGDGNDLMLGDDGNDIISGDNGNDSGFGGAGDDSIRGLLGNDALFGEAGNDTILGDAGNDLILGGAGRDSLFGGDGNDTVEGGADGDTMDGGAGARDMLSYATSGAAVAVNLGALTAGGGDATGDVFRGFEDLTGSAWDDNLTGSNGANILIGGGGRDEINGGGGNDTIRGDAEFDRLTGGAGRDVFVFFGIADSGPALPDIITDFVQGLDRIDLQGIDNTVVPLTLIGHNVAFTGVAGELRSRDTGFSTFVEIDSDGDANADFAVFLNATVVVINAADLIL